MIYPLGHPVELLSDSPEIQKLAQSLWGQWPALFDEPPLRMSAEIVDGPASSGAPDYRTADGAFTLTSDPTNASFSANTRSGHLQVTRATLSCRAAFSYHFLEPWILTALDVAYFDPLHAACVSRDGRGILLCGDSGAGKTTLAYACARAGWTVISDDGAHLAPGLTRTVCGGFWRFRLREGVRHLFPELAPLPSTRMPNQKMAMEVDACRAGLSVGWSASVHQTVFLCRRPGPAKLSQHFPEAALEWCLRTSKRPDRDSSRGRLEAMLEAGCLSLAYETVEEAVALLESLP